MKNPKSFTFPFIQVDESQHKDSNRLKLRGTGQVYHLTCVSNPNDLATIFELDPTSAQRVDDMVPKYEFYNHLREQNTVFPQISPAMLCDVFSHLDLIKEMKQTKNISNIYFW